MVLTGLNLSPALSNKGMSHTQPTSYGLDLPRGPNAYYFQRVKDIITHTESPLLFAIAFQAYKHR